MGSDSVFCTVLYCTVLYCFVLYCTVLYSTMNTTLHCTAMHYTALYCTALHCTGLHSTTLQYAQKYCTVDVAVGPPEAQSRDVRIPWCRIWQRGRLWKKNTEYLGSLDLEYSMLGFLDPRIWNIQVLGTCNTKCLAS